MKIHNKFEVKLPSGKKVVAFNQMFSRVLDALEAYLGFAKYVSVGSGRVLPETHVGSLENEHMTQSVGIFASTEDGYQLNPEKGSLFLRRKIVIPENVLVGTDLSEIGFCVLPSGTTGVSGDPEEPSTITLENLSPSLYNYAYFVDEDKNPTTVYKGAEALEIYATVFLDWDTSQNVLPLGGNNEFIKFLMGSPVYDGTAPTFDFGCGYDHRPNLPQVEQNYHHVSNPHISTNVLPTISKTDNAIEFFFASTHGRAMVPEIVLVANGKSTIRNNRFGELYDNGTTTYTETVRNSISSDGYVLLSKPYAGPLVKVEDLDSGNIYDTPEELAAAGIKRADLSGQPSDPVAPAFEKDYNLQAGWNVTSSKCGKYIIFSNDTDIDVFEVDDGILTQKDTSNVSRLNTVIEIEMMDDYLFLTHSDAPYVSCYKFLYGKFEKMHILFDEALQKYAQSLIFNPNSGCITSFGKTKYGNVLCTVKFDADTVKIFEFEEQDRFLICVSCFSVPMTGINIVASLTAHDTEDAYVVIAGKDQTNTNTVYQWSKDGGMDLVSSSYATYDFNNNVESYSVGKEFIYLKRTDSPYNIAYYFPSKRRYSLSDNAICNYSFSKNSKVLVRLNVNTTVLDSYYQRRTGGPYGTINKVSNEFFLGHFLGYIVVNDALFVFRDTAPYTIMYNYTKYGIVMVEGLDPAHGYKITHQATRIQHEYDYCYNLVMSLVVSFASDEEGT